MISRIAAASALAIGLVSSGVLAQESGSASPAAPSSRGTDPGAQPSDQPSRQGPSSQTAQNNQEQENKLSPSDRRFIDAAARANEQETKLGELAKSRGQSDDVKRFGQRLIDDHTNANEQLKALADKKGITLATPPCPGEQHPVESRLSKLSNDRFDREYLSEVMQNHLKEVSDFQRAARDANDPELREYAQETLPMLLEHERLVNDIRSDIAAPASGNAQPSQTTTKSGAPPGQGGSQNPQGGSQNPEGGSQNPEGGSQNPSSQPPRRTPGGPAGKAPAPSTPSTPSTPTPGGHGTGTGTGTGTGAGSGR